jgi:hypothetical protein
MQGLRSHFRQFAGRHAKAVHKSVNHVPPAHGRDPKIESGIESRPSFIALGS